MDGEKEEKKTYAPPEESEPAIRRMRLVVGFGEGIVLFLGGRVSHFGHLLDGKNRLQEEKGIIINKFWLKEVLVEGKAI